MKGGFNMFKKKKKQGVITRDLKEFISTIPLRRRTLKSTAINLQKKGYVDPNYNIPIPKKKKKILRRRKHVKGYIIRGGKAYPIG